MVTRMDHAAPSVTQASPTSPTGASLAPARPTFPPRSSSMRVMGAAPAAVVVDAPPAVSLEPPANTTFVQFLRTWSDAHVGQWLHDIRCPGLAHTFSTNDLRGDVLLELDADTLKEMNVGLGDRLRVMNALKVLRQKCSARIVLREGTNTSTPTPTPSHSRSASATDPLGSLSDRPSGRRLETGRPAPLRIPTGSSSIIAENSESARLNRGIPFPTPTTATPNTTTGSAPSTSVTAPHSSRGQPLSSGPRTGPPGPRPARNLVSNHVGYRTPTQAEVNAYNYTPLPPAPAPPGKQLVV
jgi:mitogen-activated protein kinase kinase kinase